MTRLTATSSHWAVHKFSMPAGRPPTWCWLSLRGHRRCIHCPHHEPANSSKQPKLAKAVCPLDWLKCYVPGAEGCQLAGSEGHDWLLTMIFDVRLTFTLYLLLRCHRSTATRMEFFMRFDTTCGGSCAHDVTSSKCCANGRVLRMHGYMEVEHAFTFPMNSCTIVATLTGGQWCGCADVPQCCYDEPQHCRPSPLLTGQLWARSAVCFAK